MQFGDIARLAELSPQIYQYSQMTLAEYLESLAEPEPKYYAARLELQVCHFLVSPVLLMACHALSAQMCHAQRLRQAAGSAV